MPTLLIVTNQPRYESMRHLNIHPLVTDLRDIDAAVEAYVTGTLVDRIDRLH